MKTVVRNSYTPKTGDYCETIVVDKETENAYIFDCDGVFTEVPQPVDVERILREAKAYTDETVAPINEKLDTIEEGAQANKIETIKRNGVVIPISNKTVDVIVPTKTSDIINDGSAGTDTYVESAALDNYYTKTETDTLIESEETAREIADEGLQEQIDAIVASSDVVDIVGTYATLQAYDTSKLHDNDIIKVLADETKDEATTYYRWNKNTSTWSYIGAEGPFYTKAESDATFVPQTRTVNSKPLSSNITLTATDVGALPDSTAIPTVNNATLTIQKNGSTLNTFTANSSTNKTVDITVPTKVSDITNDLDFVSEEDIYNEQCESGTTITFQDSAPSKLSSFSISGNTVQNGTPTPDAPVAVQTVTGENVIRLCGKNLLKPYDQSGTISVSGLVTTLHNDGSISINGTSTAETYIEFGYQFYGATSRQSVPIYSLNPSLTYNLSSTYTGTITGGAYPPRLYAQYNGEFQEVNAVFGSSVNITGSNGIYRSWLRIRSGTSFDNVTFYPQLELGSTATAYEPYQGQSYKVNLGKNLFDKDNANIFNGYLGNSGIVEAANARAVYIPVVAGQTYTFSRANSTSQVNDPYYAFIANEPVGGGQYLEGRHAVGQNDLTFTATAPVGSKYLIFYFAWNPSAATLATILSTYQLELGSQATSYAAYFEPIELCKIGDYQDYIYKSGGRWYVHKECGKANLSSITWEAYAGTLKRSGINPIANMVYVANNQQVGAGLTEGFSIRKGGGLSDASLLGYFAIDTNRLAFNVGSGGSDPVGNLYYALATPTDAEITNAALVAQLEAILSQGYTYTGTNNITTVIAAGNVQGELEICYTNTILPLATKDTPGIVQVGDGLVVDSNGVVSATGLTSVEWDDIEDAPTNVSYFTNDAGYITPASLPAVNDGTLTIRKNGTNVATFSANQSGDATADISVPTKTSDLTNDSNFITTSALGNYYTKSETYTQGEVNSLINTISVPTKTSDLVNDSGFITSIPTASANTLGGIKVGTNLSIDANGVLSADAQSITVDSALSTASENPAQNKIITTALNSKADSSSIGNATLTIQKNGTNVQTFTANSSTDKTANIQVPNLQTSNTDPGEGAALAADTFLGVYDVAPSAIDGARITDGTITPAKTTFTTYSTTEKAVGEWIDGKTIYRKTVNVGALPNNASKNTAHGISNLDTVIDCRGFAKATWGTQYPIPAVYASGDAGYNTQVSVDNTNITLSCTGNNSGKSGYVTIWYTKSS